MTDRNEFDDEVDVLVIGSGAGGMTAALAASARGLKTPRGREGRAVRRIERALRRRPVDSRRAGAGAARATTPTPTKSSSTSRRITAGAVSTRPARGVRRQGAEDARVPRGARPATCSSSGSPATPTTSRSFPAALRGGASSTSRRSICAASATTRTSCSSRKGFTPKGFWIKPNELVDFYRLRQTLKGKRAVRQTRLADGACPGLPGADRHDRPGAHGAPVPRLPQARRRRSGWTRR